MFCTFSSRKERGRRLIIIVQSYNTTEGRERKLKAKSLGWFNEITKIIPIFPSSIRFHLFGRLENRVFSFIIYCSFLSCLVIYHCLAEPVDRLSRFFSRLFLFFEEQIFLKNSRKKSREEGWKNYCREILFFFYYLVLYEFYTRVYVFFFFFFSIKSDELRIFRDTMRLAKRVEMCMHLVVNTE